MTGRERVLSRRWRAPHEDGAALVDPPLAAVAELLESNLASRLSGHCEILGRSLTDLARDARGELLSLARTYTSGYRELPPAADDSAPILLAGHQPELFHSGVWFKNFVLSSLAGQFSAQAVNLLIDNDTVRSTSIRVPGGSLAEPRVEQVAFDELGPHVPYEEREIVDSRCFESFGARASEVLAPLVPAPLLRELWPAARDAASRTRNLGRALAEARHRLEGSLGLSTLELPLSAACETDSFRWFAAGLLAGLPRLYEIYNSSLAEYRQANKLRSRSHPVPDLAEDQGYLEAPFWLWTCDDPQRRRLFVLRHADRLEVTDRKQVRFQLPLAGERAVEALREQSTAGIRLRPRALVTTMYARLLLTDLFVHGIGGGKYDQLTDLILSRYFELPPPAFLVATATVRLPVQRPKASVSDLLRLVRTGREMRFHPERFLGALRENGPQEAQRLMAQKEAWLADDGPRGDAHARHQAIDDLNLALQPYLAEERRQLGQERDQLNRQLRAGAVLGSREYAFCLFPKEFVVPLLAGLAK